MIASIVLAAAVATLAVVIVFTTFAPLLVQWPV